MTYIGMDVHKQETQVCIEDGGQPAARGPRRPRALPGGTFSTQLPVQVADVQVINNG